MEVTWFDYSGGNTPSKTMRSLLEQHQPIYSQADLKVTVQQGEIPEHFPTRVLEAIPSSLKTLFLINKDIDDNSLMFICTLVRMFTDKGY